MVATLDAQARFEATVALDLVDPDELDEAAVGGDHMNGDPFPGLVSLVVFHLDVHGKGPALLVEFQGVFARLGFHGREEAFVVLWSEKQAGICEHEEGASRTGTEGTPDVMTAEFGPDVSKTVLGRSREWNR